MIRFSALPTDVVRHYQAGGADAYGLAPERKVSDGGGKTGGGNPFRHCLRMVPEGAGMLVLAYRPFAGLHPYAEMGPIFLCAKACARFEGAGVPEVLASSPDYLIKGYGADDRIVYGTGAGVPVARGRLCLWHGGGCACGGFERGRGGDFGAVRCGLCACQICAQQLLSGAD